MTGPRHGGRAQRTGRRSEESGAIGGRRRANLLVESREQICQIGTTLCQGTQLIGFNTRKTQLDKRARERAWKTRGMGDRLEVGERVPRARLERRTRRNRLAPEHCEGCKTSVRQRARRHPGGELCTTEAMVPECGAVAHGSRAREVVGRAP